MNCKTFVRWIRRYNEMLVENINDYHMTPKEAAKQAEEDIVTEFEDCCEESDIIAESEWARGG